MSSSSDRLWTVVLAGGDGTRLRPLTRALHGEDLPKQFAKIREDHTLLQATLDRTSRFCSDQRTLVIIAREREQLARAQLTEHVAARLVLQPRNLGTAPGILLPLAHLAPRSSQDLVAIVPSDHFVADEEPFIATIEDAAGVAARERAIVLVGAAADRAETEYGWIVPKATPPSASRAVARFVEKPKPLQAERLLHEGALWNTFVLVAPLHELHEALRSCLPDQAEAFDAYQRALGTPNADVVLSTIYARISAADFSRDVLAQLKGLRVVTLPPCGWSDWGTPERVFQSLSGTADLQRLSARLSADASRLFGFAPSGG